MRLLLDTHVILWWLDTPERILNSTRKAIENVENPVFVSAASAWEIAIKRNAGKLTLTADIEPSSQ